MATASVQHEFDLPVDALWELLGEFGNMSKWTGLPPETCVSDGEEVGAIRTLSLPNGGTIIDRLDAKSEHSYSYSIINMEEAPLPFSSYKATLAVQPISESRSRLEWGGEFTPDQMSEAETVAFAQNMYQRGLDMMIRAAANLQTSNWRASVDGAPLARDFSWSSAGWPLAGICSACRDGFQMPLAIMRSAR